MSIEKQAAVAHAYNCMDDMEKVAFLGGLLAGAKRLATASAPAMKNVAGNASNAFAAAKAMPKAPTLAGISLLRNPLVQGAASVGAGMAAGKATDSGAAGAATGIGTSYGLRALARRV